MGGLVLNLCVIADLEKRFTLDPSSPSNHLELEEAEEVDYEILSKVIQTAAA